jgi:hypothetical protein
VKGRWMRGKGCDIRIDVEGRIKTASTCKRESVTRGE